MAILTSCCCWKGLRRASYACAIYTFMYFILSSMFLWLYIQEMMEPIDPEKETTTFLLPKPNEVQLWVRYLIFIAFVTSIIGSPTSLLLIIGIWKDKKLLLLPWIFVYPSIFMLETIYVGYIIYENWNNVNPAVAMIITLDFFFFVLGMYSVLCVISQYQELRAGRGTAIDERRSFGSAQFSRNLTVNSCEVGGRKTAIYESKAQTNGFSPRHSRLSLKSVSRGPSIKISRIEKESAVDLSGQGLHTSESCEATGSGNVTCAASLAGDNSSSFTQENLLADIAITRIGSKKKVQFPNEEISAECPTGEENVKNDEPSKAFPDVINQEFLKTNKEESPLL